MKKENENELMALTERNELSVLKKQIQPQRELFTVVASKDLLFSLNEAFSQLVVSDYFSDRAKNDKETLVYHWQLLREYLEEVYKE
jgi:hypothetical protein